MHLPIRLLPCLLLLLVVSCGQLRKTAGDGLIQKRRHLSGWHVDLGGKKAAGHPLQREIRKDARTVAPQTSHPRLDTLQAELMLTAGLQEAMPAAPAILLERSVVPVKPLEAMDPLLQDLPIITETSPDPPTQEDLMPKKRWNKFAVPAFLTALATVYLGLFGVSTIAVIGGLIVTFTLAGISLRQIRSRDESGKGFAIAAMLIALLATLATAMVTAVVGFI